MQENWIGKSRGLQFRFRLAEAGRRRSTTVEVFTTRPDTIFGASFVAIAAGHPIAAGGRGGGSEGRRVHRRMPARRDQRGRDRDRREEGLSTPDSRSSIRSIPSWRLPVYIANFVLMDYGTGAIFGVPGHDQRDFEFATQISICRSGAWSRRAPTARRQPIGDEAETGAGVAVNSQLPRRPDDRAGDRRSHPPRRSRRLGPGHDRSIGCATGACRASATGARRSRSSIATRAARSPVPRDQLPVVLPEDVELRHARQPARPPSDLEACRLPELRRRGACARPTRSTPSSIRAGISSASPASRTTGRSTAPRPRNGCRSASISAGSSMRSCTCSTRASGPARCSSIGRDRHRRAVQGPVHARHGHPRDLSRRRRQLAQPRRGRARRRRLDRTSKAASRSRRGRVEKMSKSKRNTVDPEPILAKYGADAVRWFMLSDSPPERDLEWSEGGIEGAARFVQRVWRLAIGDQPAARARTRRSSASSTAPSPRSARRSRGCSSTRRSPQLYELTSAIEKAAAVGDARRGRSARCPADRADGAAPRRGSLGGARRDRAWSPTPPGRRSTRRCWSTTR